MSSSADLEREAQLIGQRLFQIPDGCVSETVNSFVSAIINAAVCRISEKLA